MLSCLSRPLRYYEGAMVKKGSKKPGPTVGAAAAAPASDDASSVEVSVLSKGGEVLFVEAGSDFVDTLARVLQQPLGAVAGCVGDGEEKKVFWHVVGIANLLC